VLVAKARRLISIAANGTLAPRGVEPWEPVILDATILFRLDNSADNS
jgi:hypothetical protein